MPAPRRVRYVTKSVTNDVIMTSDDIIAQVTARNRSPPGTLWTMEVSRGEEVRTREIPSHCSILKTSVKWSVRKADRKAGSQPLSGKCIHISDIPYCMTVFVWYVCNRDINAGLRPGRGITGDSSHSGV